MTTIKKSKSGKLTSHAGRPGKKTVKKTATPTVKKSKAAKKKSSIRSKKTIETLKKMSVFLQCTACKREIVIDRGELMNKTIYCCGQKMRKMP